MRPASDDADRQGRAPDSRPERLLYVVATVHLDTQWRWTIQETIRRFLPDTLRRNFELFERHPHYVLSFEGAFRYMLAREYHPELYRRLREWVQAGRWRPAGGMLDAADVNLVSPESLIRQLLYGTRFFRRELGTESVDLFLPDCFGFGASLPSIAAHCGLRGFSSQKFIKYMAPAAIPFALGLWEGPDGSSIVAALDPEGYGDGIDEDLSRARRWQERIEDTGRRSGLFVGYKYFGTGDRGGAPDENSLVWLRRGLERPGPLRLVHDGSDRLFRDLDPASAAALPRHRGDLLLPTHGTGCYTSLAALKRWNRKNELLADAAERAAAACAWLGAMPYPDERLRAGWLRFLWHQMHDDLTGTSVPAAYRFTWNDEAVAGNLFATVVADAVGGVARGLDTDLEGVPLVLFNPLSIARREAVSAVVRFTGPPPAAVRVFDPDGREVPAQVCARPPGGLRIAFLAALPPVGFAVYEVRPAASSAEPDRDGGLGISERHLENHRYRVELDGRGDLASLRDKRLDRELLAAPAGLELLADRSTRWPAWEVLYSDLAAPARERMGAPARIRVRERGPVRVVLEVARAARGSRLRQRLTLAAGDAGERLEIANECRWRARGRLLKACFPFALEAAEATYDLGLGAIERGVNRPELYEVPAQQWADLSSRETGLGVSVLSDCRYGWDRPAAATLRLTLLRSPGNRRRHPHQATQDFGPHRFVYALHAHTGGWADGDTVWQAARLNQPPLVFQARRRAGSGRALSLLSVGTPQVAVRAVKRAEESDELVVRLQETRGRPARGVEVAAAARVVAAREVNGLEDPLAEARIRDGKLVADLGPFQPRAFALRLEAPARPLAAPRQRPLELPLDLAAASFHGQRRGPDFDRRGHSLPGELLPESVEHGGVRFELARPEPGAAHCLACRGQEVALPAGDFDRLFLLATRVGPDGRAVFGLDGREVAVRVGHWSRPIGQWARQREVRGVTLAPPRRPFLRRDPIAWLFTHRHDRRVRDEPYVFCYLFRYVLELPPGTRSLGLPTAPHVRLFAATLAADSNDQVTPAEPLFEL